MKLTIFLPLVIVVNLFGINTLAIIKLRGHLICGVNGNLPGFSVLKQEKWSGMDVDYCRALSVAIFKSPKNVKFVKITEQDKFQALSELKVDILSRNTTWTMQRDAQSGVEFVGVIYYGGQGFLILKDFGLDSAFELHNANICMSAYSTEEKNVKNYFKKHNMKYTSVINKGTNYIDDFEKGKCDVLVKDKSTLYSIRSTLKNPSLYKIMPETISKEPFSPVIRDDDENWLNITKSVLNVLIEAEELGISKENVSLYLESKNENIKKLLGLSNKDGKTITELQPNWSYLVIKSIGNYKEIFDKNLGANSILRLERGINSLWNNGGLMYSIPMQ